MVDELAEDLGIDIPEQCACRVVAELLVPRCTNTGGTVHRKVNRIGQLQREVCYGLCGEREITTLHSENHLRPSRCLPASVCSAHRDLAHKVRIYLHCPVVCLDLLRSLFEPADHTFKRVQQSAGWNTAAKRRRLFREGGNPA